MPSACQSWVHDLPIMQQSVLFAAVRGPDGIPKYHVVKFLLRWYRRCVLVSALDGHAILDPITEGGGSFTGPSLQPFDRELAGLAWPQRMHLRVDEYLRAVDELPHHFQLHFLHAAEIVGYKHPDETIRTWWCQVYFRLVHDMHLWPETEEQMDQRLGDSEAGWLARADMATVA